ncbi:MAG: mannitol dehydrogenase [Pelagibacterium sp. SCN 63-23]|nr:MAG: mannitol dehydrogenase [Pelagibacterium sp. SCN 63-23]
MTIELSLATLPEISTATVPRYARADLTAGIVHFGVGNFHRAHQAVYLDALFNQRDGHDWAIVGAGVRAADETMRQRLKGQDWLTTVVEQEADTGTAHVTGAMIDYLEPGSAETTIARLADPAIRIVSLTITEGGYYIDPASQLFDPTHPDIVWDATHLDTPKTAFGLILAGLVRRRAVGIPPFTVMSCDNIPGNGHVTRNAVAGLAALVDPDLADWVRSAVAFPNGMVDRITPATSAREIALLDEQFGIADVSPVFCETFRQWVLEDNFPAGRPALEKVGVQFVSDVAPYEHMKIRILNGGHATIAYPAGLLDIHFVHEAMQHPLIRCFLAKVEREEIIPLVPPVPNTDLHAYFELCERRFANPKIGDTIRRLALDGSNRQPKFIIPSLMEAESADKMRTGLTLVAAFWCRYCYGISESGAEIAANDPAWERLTAQAKRARSRPAAWLEMADIYGNLSENTSFINTFSRLLDTLWSTGTTATLERYLAGEL